MTLCERVLQPLWGASIADGFSVFQAAARRGSRSNTILALQPLSASLFEEALADLHAKSSTKLPFSARIVAASRRANSCGASEASDGAALAAVVLHECQTNTKLLYPHAASTAVVGAVSAAAPNEPAHAHAHPNTSGTSSNSSVIPSRIKSSIVPPLNLSRIATEGSNPISIVHPSIPATALTARSEWLRRGGQVPPVLKPRVPVGTAISQVGGASTLRIESDAVLEVEMLLREKQQRMQELSSGAVSSQYRSLKCPSPDLGYRVVFNGSSNFNMFRPFDTVRLISARSSRTILNRAVAPLSERQMPPRRPHHGQYISYREDFFDDDKSRAATRSSRRHPSSARSTNVAAVHKLQAKLDSLEGDALKAVNMTFAPRHQAAAARAFSSSTRSPITEISQAPAVQPCPPQTKKATAEHALASARVRRAELTTSDSSVVVHKTDVPRTAREGRAL
jgi:hypothetical protein